jgi:hypothetical protein
MNWGSMSNDIFDHPDLHDGRWKRVTRRELRRTALRGTPRWWLRYRRRIISVTALVALVGAGTLAINAIPRGAKVPDGASPLTTETASRPVKRVDLAQPFAGTPAAGWSDGESGIVMPEAVPTNGFTVAQVTEALNLARKALVTALVDPKVIRGEELDRLAALFAPDAGDVRDPAVTYRTKISPIHQLLPVPPKVNMVVTVGPGNGGELAIHTRYAVAYAFAPEDPNSSPARWTS